MNVKRILHNGGVTILTLAAVFVLVLVMQQFFQTDRLIPMLFVLGVFIVSRSTEGYLWGIVASLVGVLLVNYAFMFPYYAIDLLSPVNLATALVMLLVSVMTSTLTTQISVQQAEKAAAERERMRANLLRAISHDLRTPLTSIYGSCSLMVDNDIPEDRRRELLCDMREDAEWLVRMVENLLSITRIDSGQVKIIKTPMILDELIDSVILKFKKRYPMQKVALELPDEVVLIPMDAILIEQVIVNILENAVQHAQGMTALTLRVFTLGNKAIFEIADNGCGIDPKYMDTLFTGYYTSEREIADSQKKNAGIGLSVCATIIEAHGGSIKAENLKTGGAVFRFALDTEAINDEAE